MPKVFISRRIVPAGIEQLQKTCDVTIWDNPEPISQKELHENAQGCDGIITMITDPVDAQLFDAAGSQLKVVCNYGVGYNNIDLEEATKRGIRIGNTPGVLTDATADTAASLLLAVARRIPEAQQSIHAGTWKTWEPLGFIGADLVNQTLGIVGLGRIGYAMAKRFHHGWDMNILYTSRTPKLEAEQSFNAKRVEFETLLQESDFISVHTDLNPETEGLFNKTAFEKMKSTAIFINTGRGKVHHQADLYDALKNGVIAGAGLDVTEPEPIPLDDPLLTLPNCTIVPHIGSATVSTRNKMADIAAKNILAGIQDQPLLHQVNHV